MAEFSDLGFYYDPSRAGIDWGDRRTLISVNPEWQRRDPAAVEASRSALPDLPAHIWLSTSGSSATVPGRVRWVALSTAAFLASAAAVNRHLQSDAADVWAHALPVFHVGGLGILARAALSGARVIPAVSARWDATRFRERVAEAGATLSALVPPQVHDLVHERLQAPEHLRAVVVGGARLDPALCADARRLGWPCLPSYGLTETCSQVATAAVAQARSADCTGPLPILAHAEIRADADGRLHVRGPSLLTCYAEMTAEGLRSWDPKRDGWLETADLGRVTPGGLEVSGRSGDSVKVLGEIVSVTHVEDVLRRWVATESSLAAGHADMAVVALPHERLGHEMVLVLATADRARLEPLTAPRLEPSLDAFSRDALLPYERVRRVVWVDAIPRTALGKCQRQLLAKQVSLEAGSNR